MALVCMICGCKQYDEDTIRSYRKQYPGLDEQDIPYVCGACMDAGNEGSADGLKTIEIFFRDLVPDAQKRLLKGYGMKSPKEGNWDQFPVFTLYPELEDLNDFED